MTASKFDAPLPEDDQLEPDEIVAIESILGTLFGIGVNSTNRLDVMLDQTHGHSWRTFFPIFQEAWPRCDATWNLQEYLLGWLQEHHSERDWVWPAIWAFPERVRVYRGASFWKAQGVSWTMDRKVAEAFARGHRGIRPERPVIASAMIQKDDIFAYIPDRGEDEVVLDPTKLIDLSFEEWGGLIEDQAAA